MSRSKRSIFGRVLAPTLVVTTITLAVVNAGAPAPAAGLGRPTNFIATATSPSTIDLRWQPAPEDGRVRHAVITYDHGRAVWSARWTCASCSAMTLDALTAGGRYEFGLYSMDNAGNRSGWAWLSTTLPATACGTASRFCVAVDAADLHQPLNHTGSGFLHSATGVPESQVAPLRPKAWRIAALDAAAMSGARASGATVTALLSDAFARRNTVGSRLVRNPWDDWPRYRTFVTDTVRWHLDNGLLPDWWEIQNEPNPDHYGLLSPPTRDRILEQFRVAHNAIRAVIPAAKIVGPSLAGAVWAKNALIDIYSFLDFVDAKRLRFDVISWHPIGGRTFSDFQTQPQVIVDDASIIRQLIREHAALGPLELTANEYGAPFWRGNPGATVKYFDALERSGIVNANLACYPTTTNNWLTRTSTCEPGHLDGLRTPSGAAAADYWTYVSYAAMDGPRVGTHSDNPWVSTFATATAGAVSVIVGRAHNCDPSVQSFCPPGTRPDPPVGGDVVVDGLAVTDYTVTVDRIPNVTGAVAAPIRVSAATRRPSLGRLRVSLGTVSDGDAVVVKLTPR